MRPRVFVYSAATLLSLFSLAPTGSAQDVRITEFMASNPSPNTQPWAPLTRDEDGEYSDWIEITNMELSDSVNLQNWGLTDNQSQPFQWRFPATNLNAGASIIVFASGKNRRVPGSPLHTDFGLSAGGEYLALVRPDGTIATEFDEYPTQVPNVSYGFGQLTTNRTLINSNASVRVRVPTSGAEGMSWTNVTYDDSGWILGTNGVGYGSTNVAQADYGAGIAATAPIGHWRLSETSGTTAANIGSGAGLNGTYTLTTLGTAGPRPPDFNGFEANNNAPTFALTGPTTGSFVAVNNSLLSDRSAFTIGGWIRPSAAAQLNRTGLFGQNDAVEFGFINPTTLQCWTPNGGSLNVTYPFPLNTWHHVVAVGDGTSIRIFLDGTQAGSAAANTANYGTSTFNFNIGGGGIFDSTTNFFNGQIDEVVLYQRALAVPEIQSLYQAGLSPAGVSVVPFVRTDIGAAMSNINASAYMRFPFTVNDPLSIGLLTLRLRYDDGAAVFINGSEVLRINGPEPLAFDSSATEAHLPIGLEEFRIGPSMLVTGQNVVAIQGLNLAANDEDFLLVADMVATVITASSTTPLYFTRPTPGAANSGGVALLGPAILEATHSPNVPKDNEDILVTARVTQTFYPVTNVVMRYRVMFGADIELAMFDDGLHGDGAAGDGTYAATIPAAASTPSQMVRWFFRATDDRGNTSRWPLFTDPANSTEFLGTMVDYVVTSKLPVVHLFAPANILQPPPGPTGQVGADSQGGARVSLFFDGEFYDNIHMQLRGNTTANFNKKSHRLEFNNDHAFRHSDAYPRVTKTSFVADYGDPAYMRQGLAFWLCNLIGSPTSFYEPMRLQLNGQFYQLANHSDVQDQDLLERLGFDPNGALYNAAGRVTLPTQSTGGFEKKTRRWDTQADYNSVATRLAETNALATRRINAYDIFDIPNAINYLVAARWSHENDDIWANLSLYHDNDGDDQWRIIAFDMNLSWGAIFFEGTQGPLIGVGIPGNVIGTYDAHKGHPLYGSQANVAVSGPNEGGTTPGGSAFNRVYDVFFQNPDLRQMYLRRLRTMMDQYVKPAGQHPLLYPMETRVRQLYDMMAEEAERDRNAWQWPARGGQCNFDPGIRFTQGVNDLINYFIIPRRQHFYVTHSITNTSKVVGIGTNNNAGIPLPQPADAAIMVAQVEYNPGSGNQLHEYLTVTNPNPYAVDISGWKLEGGVEFTFAPGTVLPSNGVAYISPDVRAFKARPVAPRGGMGLFVLGPYRGQLSARGEPLMISNDRGSMVYSNVYAGAPSALQNSLRITEIMYSPTMLAGNTNDAETYEFIELKNVSSTDTLSLAGVRFTEGITFDFTGSAITSLAPGERVLVVKNPVRFQARYGSGLPVAGTYVGNLDNSGDRIILVDSTNEEIHDFDYEDDWYPITAGGGFSLAIVDENADPGEWDNKTNWRPSGQEQGAPGQPETAPGAFPPIIVNEVLTRTELPALDTIELFNPTASEVNISGWFLTDDFSDAKKFRIPDGTTIPAGGYLLFDEDDFNFEGTGFAFGADGDEAYIFSADGSSNLTGYAHGYAYSAAGNGVSFGRHTNSVGDIHFVAQTANSLPGQNAGPRVGPLIISEFMYRPTDLANGQDNENDEYIELQNVSGAPVQLFDPAYPENTWQLRGGVEFNFPPDVTVPAGGFVLIANFDVTDTGRLNAFRQKYNVPAEVPVFGPYEGRLANDADEIELKRPDNVFALPEPIVVSIMVEQVDYTDEAPWPSTADGTGVALHRTGTTSYANDPASWVAAAPSAGGAAAPGTAPTITSQPQGQAALATATVNFNVVADGSGPLRYQWRRDGQNLAGGTNSVFSLEDVRPEHAGQYSVTVYNDAGATVSSNASLTVSFGAYIFTQPASTNVRPNQVANFSISAYTASTLTYQWRFNGANIPGANSSSYTISSVQLSDHGIYDVVLTDEAGTLVSAPALLQVMVNPIILQQPLGQTVPRGGSVTVSVLVTNTATLPIEFRWRVASRNTRTNLLNRRYDFFTISNVVGSSNINVGLVNVGGSLLSASAIVTPVDDFDADGMPDAWEVVYGFNTNNAADALQDFDLDTARNRDEYIAGTDPSNPQSYLRVNGTVAGGEAILTFQGVTNRTYGLLSVDALGAPWSTLAPVVARSTNRIETITDPVAGQNQRFYRLVTPYPEE